MTTIACNRKAIAGDQQATCEGGTNFRTTKIFRVGSSIFGLCGDDYANVFLDWAKRAFSEKDKPVFPDSADFQVLELSPQGIFLWGEHLTRVEILDPNYAIGSGGRVALYAMRVLKLPPAEAVVEAAKIDPWTDNNVDKLDL